MAEMTTEPTDGAHFAPQLCPMQEHETASTISAFSGAMVVATQPGRPRSWCSEHLMTPRGSRRRGRQRRVRERSSLGTHISTVASYHEDDGLFAQVRQRDDISLFTLTKQFVLEIKKQHDCLSHRNTVIAAIPTHKAFGHEQVRLT